MSLIRLYIRVLRMLGTESRLGWTLAIANLGLAAAQFADPVLFGRIIDTLVNAEKRAGTPTWAQLTPLLLAWIGFALFTIVCGALTALYADRLAHRRRHGVLTEYFEHILQLPFSYPDTELNRLLVRPTSSQTRTNHAKSCFDSRRIVLAGWVCSRSRIVRPRAEVRPSHRS